MEPIQLRIEAAFKELTRKLKAGETLNADEVNALGKICFACNGLPTIKN